MPRNLLCAFAPPRSFFLNTETQRRKDAEKQKRREEKPLIFFKNFIFTGKKKEPLGLLKVKNRYYRVRQT